MFNLVGTPKPFIMVHSELKAYIESKPHIENVWLAEDGSWYFVPMEGLKQHSREEILGTEETPIEETPIAEVITEETPIEEVPATETQTEQVEPTPAQSPKKQSKK